MKRRLYSKAFLLFLFCFPALAFSQEVDEIIAKHIEAHGGLAKWNEINALKISGTFTGFSLEKDFSCYKMKSGFYYADLYLGEINVIEGFNGKEGWTIDPWQEMDYARKLNSEEVNVFLQKAEFFTPFYNYKEKGHKVVLKGKETIEGLEVFVLELTRDNNKVETWYLNAETYLEYICKSDWVDFARNAPAETFFDDFREVDGLVLPFFIERTFWQRDRILQIENIEINPEVDMAIFEMPRREEMKMLEFMEGEWEVQIEVWTRRGSWYNLGNTHSSIDFASINLLQENITYERIFSITKQLNYTYNEQSKNYRISVFNDLNSNLRIFEGTFNDTSFVYNDVNIHYANTTDDESIHIQYEILKNEDGGFSIIRSQSTDKGESWSPSDRFIYSREDD
jgi:hypothetical protein